MREREYAYHIGETYIVYHLGRYCIAHIYKSDKGTAIQFVRQYKTLRGAENYMLKDYSYSKRNAPEIEYATEAYIRKGEYWR